MKIDLYKNLRTEPDMRQEIINTLDGSFPEIAKKQIAVLRKMRIPAQQCPCVDAVTHEPDKDTFCPFCWGEGFLWDEIFIDFYKVPLKGDAGNSENEEITSPGLMNEPIMVFYIRYSVDLTDNDKIIELQLDREGQPIRPYQRKRLYRIGTLIDMRSDNGRLEYWKVDCYSEFRKFLNGSEDY